MYSIDYLSIESYGDLGIPKLEKRAAHVRLERHPAKIQKVKVKKYTFWLFDFSSSLSPFRLFGFSSSLSTLNGLSFVLLAGHVQLERHPAKIQTVKKWKVKKYTFRLFDFSKLSILSAWSLAAHHLLPSCGHFIGENCWENGEKRDEGQRLGTHGDPSLRWSHRDFPNFPMGIWWWTMMNHWIGQL